MRFTTSIDLAHYDYWVKHHPQGTFWQSLERKAYAKSCGLETNILASESQEGKIEATAMIVEDKGKWGTVWEIPRGPIWSNEKVAEALLLSIEEMAKKEGVTAVYISPSTPLLLGEKWKPSKRHVYPEATRVIDLTKTEDELLGQMHQKGRYNIRVAEKAGVAVRKGTVDDIDTFYSLLSETKDRDGFKISSKSHYARFLTEVTGSFILIAEHERKPTSGLIGVVWNGVGIYYYGASSYAHRALMAPYLLQWEAMKYCKTQNCHTYDLLGVSKNENAEPCEAQKRSGVKDSWHGITDFKRKFGGAVLTYPPEQILVLKPVRKLIVDMKRKIFG